MNLDELLLFIEKNRTQLSKIDEDFYEKLRDRIAELEEMKSSAEEDFLFRYEDEIRTLKRLQRKIFELRTGKIISAAWAEVCGQQFSGDVENMCSDERAFFKRLIEIIKEFKYSILEGERKKAGDRVLLRIKKDVEIQGADGKTYKLRREDVVTIPQLNADALIKGGIAERIEVKEDEIPQKG
uniref:GINS subunit domain-containing protein n=1 Tax=Archaeoglobus fulgidus TaxID=2234 RepID=A0A7C3MB59_ARCFL